MNNIEILEEFIKYFEAEATQRKYRRNISITVGEDDIEAIENLIQENKELKEENHTLKEKLQMFIPRRRVRRVYKMLGKILRTDIDPILLEKELKQKDLEEGE